MIFQVKPASVEMTGYALLIYLLREGPKGELKDSIAIGRWLLKQRNECGGFISTQDTVVGLTALAKLAEATYTTDYQVKVKVNFNSGMRGDAFTFFIGKENTTTLQEYFLPVGVTSVDVEAEGFGTALAQLSWTYFTLEGGNSSGFNLDFKVIKRL
jgi:CD109 antigen